MKKSFLVMSGLASLAVGAYFASQLLAQSAPANTQATQPVGTRVAVVNIGLVFNKYVRAVEFKEQLELTMKPFKEKGKVLADQMKSWHDEMQKPNFDPKLKDQYDAGIRGNKRKLEDMQLEITKLIGKKQEDNLITLWKEVNTGVERVAQTYGFQIVIGYGDPMEKEMLNQFPNIQRKMQAMDSGSALPLYVHGSIDLSQVIADTLNSWAKNANPSVNGTPTSNK